MGEVEWEQVRREAERVIDYLELEENLQHSKRRYSQTTPLGMLIAKSSDQIQSDFHLMSVFQGRHTFSSHNIRLTVCFHSLREYRAWNLLLLCIEVVGIL